jgi:hypothetical protein
VSDVTAAPGDGDALVLVLGVYLADKENRALETARELSRSRRWRVEQRWVALGRSPVPPELAAVTTFRQESRQAKFVLLNRLLDTVDLARYAFILVTDDDITLPGGFLDDYLERVVRHDLALAQPARTHASYIDHWLVEQLDGLEARRTRFVEIGPLFSMRRDAARLLTPFSEASPMGWGYDLVWPVVMEEAGLALGIVDATPVAHDLRKPVALYDDRDAAIAMQSFLGAHPHLARHEAFRILESYA